MNRLYRLAAVVMLALVAARFLLAGDAPVNLRHTTTVEVVEKTKDAVVYISSKKIVAQRITDPFFPQFDFGTQYVPVGSLGSGFIIHPDGYIVTNNHVIDGARQISVELLDGRKFDAELISADAEAELAILKIKSDKPLPVLELGDSSDLMIGEPVIAVGNPLGFSHSVSTGIVSALHRDLQKPNDRTVLTDLIQTDAAINPGNSGGPLLNAYGQVIGINTAIRGDAQNIGFAIQINRLRDMVPELMNPSEVKKIDIPLKLKEQRRLTPPAGIETVVLNADGNVPVVSLGGDKPKDIIDAYAILLNQKVNVPFDLVLKGQPATKINPKPLPPPDALVKAKDKLGIDVVQVTPMLAGEYHLAVEDGMYVSQVSKGSIADKAGIQPGDVIMQLAQFRISTLQDFGYLLEHLPASGRVFVIVVRGQEQGRLALQF